MKLTITGLLCLMQFFVLNAQTLNLDWVKGIGSSSAEFGNTITTNTSGNVYVSGTFQGTVDFDPNMGVTNLTAFGNTDIFILKMDSLGNLLWAKQIGGVDNEYAMSLKTDSVGNVYITGHFDGLIDLDPGTAQFSLNTNGGYDLFVLKLDVSGNFIWGKQIGGVGNDLPTSITCDQYSNTYLTGSFNSTVDFDPGAGTSTLTPSYNPVIVNSDVFILKLDASGNFKWVKQIVGSFQDEGKNIQIDKARNIFTTGYFIGTTDFDPGPGSFNLSSNGNMPDCFILKLDSLGNFKWAKGIGSSKQDEGFSLAIDNSDNVILSGNFNGSCDVNTGPGTLMFHSGGTFIVKLDNAGNFKWAKQLGDTLTTYGASIALDKYDQIYIDGSFYKTQDFDPGSGIYNLTSNGGQDIFIATLDSSGNFIWARNMGGNLNDFSGSIRIRNSDIYTIGSFNGIANFEVNGGTYNMTSNGMEDLYVHKISSQIINGLKQEANSGAISVYPNPTTGILNFTETPLNKKIEIYSSLGTLVFERIPGEYGQTIDLSGLSNGMYFLKIIDKRSVTTHKIIKK